MEQENTKPGGAPDAPGELRSVIRSVIEEFLHAEQTKSEPAYQAELLDERRRREQLEQRLNELVAENKRSKQIADEAEKQSAIRTELQRLGVAKLDLAFRIVKDDVRRKEDGRLTAMAEQGEIALRDYLQKFVSENPEFLPARIAGGSGTEPAHRATADDRGLDLDKIRPGMDPQELDRVRKEIARLAAQSVR
jgi:hypothetical protein